MLYPVEIVLEHSHIWNILEHCFINSISWTWNNQQNLCKESDIHFFSKIGFFFFWEQIQKFKISWNLSWRKSLSYKTSSLIYSANQWTGFYIIGTSSQNSYFLTQFDAFTLCNWVAYIYKTFNYDSNTSKNSKIPRPVFFFSNNKSLLVVALKISSMSYTLPQVGLYGKGLTCTFCTFSNLNYLDAKSSFTKILRMCIIDQSQTETCRRADGEAWFIKSFH